MVKIIITGSKGRMGQALVACAARNPELQVTAPAADPITVAAKAALGETTIAISAIDDAMTPARALGRNLLALPERMRSPQGAAMDTAG